MKTQTHHRYIRRITLVFVGLGLIALLFLLVNVATADISPKVLQVRNAAGKSRFDLAGAVRGIGKDDLFAAFPYRRYLDSAGRWDIKTIKHDLAVLDSVTGDPDISQRTLSNALTQVLGEREKGVLKNYEPDSLLRLIQWAEQFDYYSQFDSAGELFYQSVYQYWFDIVTNKLKEYSNETPSLRHSFKFKYLVGRCYERRFSTSVKITDFEKFVDNVLYSNWGHLINATWTQSSWSVKAGLLLVFVLIVYGAYALGSKVFLLIKKSTK